MSPPRALLVLAALCCTAVLLTAALGTSATSPGRNDGGHGGLLARRKRYIVFPRGCSLNVSVTVLFPLQKLIF